MYESKYGRTKPILWNFLSHKKGSPRPTVHIIFTADRTWLRNILYTRGKTASQVLQCLGEHPIDPIRGRCEQTVMLPLRFYQMSLPRILPKWGRIDSVDVSACSAIQFLIGNLRDVSWHSNDRSYSTRAFFG